MTRREAALSKVTAEALMTARTVTMAAGASTFRKRLAIVDAVRQAFEAGWDAACAARNEEDEEGVTGP